MAHWLYKVNDALPLTYDIDALHEVSRTSLVTDTLLRDIGIMFGATIIALALGACTLRRRAGALPPASHRALLIVPLVALLAVGAVSTDYAVAAQR